MKKQKPFIAKPDTSKKAESKNRRAEPNHSTLKPIPPNPNTNSSNPRSINPRFNPKAIPEKYLLNPNDFEPTSKDPVSGGFGIINFVRNKSTGKEYAAKTSHRKTTPQERKFVLRELNILMKVQHPTIIHFEGFSFQDFQGYDNITIFIDYMEKGTLSDLLEKERHSLLPLDFDNTKRQQILVGISRGMMILHKNSVIHRDLKPENVLLDNDYKPFITDFGLSKIFTSQNSQSQSMATCGTYAYMAPEVIEGNHFSTKADVYAFGILMYEVVTGMSAMKSMTKNKPFNARKFMNSVVSGGRPTFSDETIKPGLKKMIEQCWSNNPDERPTFSEIYSKLSLNDEGFYVDSDNNICESVFTCDDECVDDEDSLMPTNFCFDYVDFDELFLYIDEINTDKAVSENDDQLLLLKKEVTELKNQNTELKAYTKKIENQNTELKKDVSKIKKENVQLKNDVSELKEIISTLKNEQQKLMNIDNCSQIEKPCEEELQDICDELAEKVKSENLTSVELPRYLQKVPNSLFKECKNLKTVKLPYSVTEIGEYAFNDCSSLSQIKITSSVTKIGGYAFQDCSSLKQIIIPSSVTEIENFAFHKCSSLEKVTLSSSLISIEQSTFEGCSSLVRITIPSSVTKIGYRCLSKCSSLEEITMPSYMTHVSTNFICESYKINKIILTSGKEERIKYIEDKFLVFKKNSNDEDFDTLLWVKPHDKKITIPSIIKKIGSFSGSTSMEQIIIPSSVTEIGDYAFNGCSSLTQITIPSSVTKINQYLFYGCKSLNQITIPSFVTEICVNAFHGCSSLSQITIPSSVTIIGQDAFDECSSLKQITIPSSVTKISFSCFSNCSALTKVTIPSSVTRICQYAFYYCISLSQIKIPSSVTEIEDYAFYNCTSLCQITIPSSVTSIGEKAFSGCSSLSQIKIPSSVTSIGGYAFYNCTSLSQITIPSSVTSIGKNAFSSNTEVIKS